MIWRSSSSSPARRSRGAASDYHARPQVSLLPCQTGVLPVINQPPGTFSSLQFPPFHSSAVGRGTETSRREITECECNSRLKLITSTRRRFRLNAFLITNNYDKRCHFVFKSHYTAVVGYRETARQSARVIGKVRLNSKYIWNVFLWIDVNHLLLCSGTRKFETMMFISKCDLWRMFLMSNRE